MLGLLSKSAFARCLNDPECLDAFGRYMLVERAVHTLNFWTRVQKIHELQQRLRKVLRDTYDRHLRKGPDDVLGDTAEERDELVGEVKPMMKMLKKPVLQRAMDDCFDRMYRMHFAPFVNLQLVVAAQQKLAESATGYVTSYRFLQGPLTSSVCVDRVRHAIENAEETTELLLNYRKEGTPFWNLLFVAPLRKVEWSVRYFLGGQIDVTRSLQMDKLPVLFGGSHMHLRESEPIESTVPCAADSMRGFASNGGEGGNFWARMFPCGNRRRRRSSSMTGRRTLTAEGHNGVDGDGPLDGGRGTAAAAGGIGAARRIEAPRESLRSQVSAFYDTYREYLILHPRHGEILYVSWHLLSFLECTSDQLCSRVTLIGDDFYDAVIGSRTPRAKVDALRRADDGAYAASEPVYVRCLGKVSGDGSAEM
ncbi:hypothetical protein HK101_011389 [Irineochytrium annulatum]|nr:hypothetical protein HK101_011389 [Irineochytrium annulatum]